MRLTHSGETLLGPAIAQAEGAAARAAAGHQHARGSAAQSVFDEGGRQHAGADQAEACKVLAGQARHIRALIAAEHDNPVFALELRQSPFQ